MTHQRACNDMSKGVEGHAMTHQKVNQHVKERTMTCQRTCNKCARGGTRGIMLCPKTMREPKFTVISLDSKNYDLYFML